MKHLSEFCFYWSVSVLVVIALFIAETPKVLVYVYSYWAIFIAYNAAEAKRVKVGGA